MSTVSIDSLKEKALWLRRALFEMIIGQMQGHIPSSYSAVEILVSLYYGGVMRLRRGEPDWPDRDRLVISKGHAAMAVYPILADLGYFPQEELSRFTRPEGILGMYADLRIPGIEGVSGSLGHGIGMASGFALAARHDGRKQRNFVLLGDGECYEGSVWESAMFAAHHRLDDVVAVIDRNQLCILGRTEDLLRLDDLAEKWRSFGWHAVEVDGHDIAALMDAFALIGKTDGKPLAIVANTVKGKGISFMENRHQWHNKMPNPEQVAQARADLGLA